MKGVVVEDSLALSMYQWYKLKGLKTSFTTFKEVCDSISHDYCEWKYVSANKSRLWRPIASDILNILPRHVYLNATNVLKVGIKTYRKMRPPNSHALDDKKRYGYFLSWLSKHGVVFKSSVFLTHDIDTSECYKNWDSMLNIEDEFGYTSVSHILTNGPYDLDKRFISSVRSRNHEIGLHGDTHDMAIGYRNVSSLQQRFIACFDAFQEPFRFFRAPALSATDELLQLLREYGFLVDSSMTTRYHYGVGSPLSIPYKYPKSSLLIAPITIQDDALLRGVPKNNINIYDYLLELLNFVSQEAGLFVINTHPVYYSSFSDAYRKLLSYLSQSNIHVLRPSDIISLTQS